MLAFVMLMFSGICGFGKQAITLMPSIKLFIQYTALRWALGEFLVCWLAADHAFSELGGARRKGRLRDWLATPTSLSEIGAAFSRSTAALLAAAVVAAGIVEACVPYGSNMLARILGDDARMQILYQVAIAVLITACHVESARYAAARTTQLALANAPTSGAWVNTLGRMGYELLVVNAISVLLSYLLTAAFTGRPLWPVMFANLRDPGFLTIFLVLLGATNLAFKIKLTRTALHRIGTMQTPDTVPDAG